MGMLYLAAAAAVVVSLGVAYLVARVTVGRGRVKGSSSGSTGNTKRNSRSERVRFPYRYADQYLFVYGNSVWTGVRLGQVTDEHLSDGELNDLVRQATHALQDLVTDGQPVEFHTRLTFRPVTADEWAAEAVDACWDPTPNYRTYVERQAEYLRDGEISRPEVYVFVKVGRVARGDEVSSATSVDAALAGTADEQLAPQTVAGWASRALDVHDRLATCGGVAMSRDDLLWVIRKTLYGHLTPPPVNLARTRPWGAGEFQLVVDLEGRNRKTHIEIFQPDEHPDSEHPGEVEKSYTSFLVAAEWPDEVKFHRRRAWLRHLSTLSSQIPGAHLEVSYRATVLPPKQFRDKIKKINGNLTEEAADMEASGRDVEPVLEKQVEQSKQLLADIDEHHLPGTEAQIMIGLSADSLTRLNSLRGEVITALNRDLPGTTWVSPRRYQWRMLQSFLPGDGPPSLPAVPYVHLQETETFGVGLPNAGAEVGDNPIRDRSGVVLGWRGNFIGFSGGVPVFYSLHVGPSRQSGGGCAMVGASGGGKSSLALLKFYQESESGVRCVALDPKTDFAQFCYYLAFGSQVNDPDFADAAAAGTLGTSESKFQPVNERFWAETEIIDVVNSRDGSLDPWIVAGSVEEGELLAETVLEQALGAKQFERCQTLVVEALHEVRNRYETRLNEIVSNGSELSTAREQTPLPTLSEVVDCVLEKDSRVHENESAGYEAQEHVHQVATTLDQLRRVPYARLLFADKPARFDALRRRRTVFTLRGIETPSIHQTDPNRWSKPARLGATIMYVLVRLTSQMLDVRQERNPVTGKIGLRPKALFIDENYVLTSMEEGRGLILRTLAQGRSYNLVTVLIDQQAGRLSSIEEEGATAGTGNQFHSVFAFLQKTPAEAQRALPLLGRTEHPSTADSLQELTTSGTCLMRDVDARVATVQVDLVFRELLSASDTNPHTRPMRQADDLSPDIADWSYIPSEEEHAVVADEETSDDEAADDATDYVDDSSVNSADEAQEAVR